MNVLFRTRKHDQGITSEQRGAEAKNVLNVTFIKHQFLDKINNTEVRALVGVLASIKVRDRPLEAAHVKPVLLA